MRHFLIILLLILTAFTASGQPVNVKSNSMDGAILQCITPMPTATTTQLLGTSYRLLSLPHATHTRNIGQPQLPSYTQIIEIPVCADIKVTASATDSVTLNAADLGITLPLLPSQPHRSRSDTTAPVLAFDPAIYAADTLLCSTAATIEPLGIERSRRLARLTIYPIAYNPQRQQFTIRRTIDIRLEYHQSDAKATANLAQQASPVMPTPKDLIPLKKPAKSIQQQAPLRYLIVSHPMFRGELDEFIAWKRHQGFITDIVYTDNPEVGSTNTEIAAYIRKQYTYATVDSPAPTYLLLVGDHEQIRAFSKRSANYQASNSHITDLYFAEWTDDFIPDCLYGRLSATNVEELQAQIRKTLLYEQYGFSDDSYLQRATLVVGVDEFCSKYCDPAMDYVASRYCNANNGFTTLTYYKYNNTIAPPGVTVTGTSRNNTASNELLPIYSQGQGLINYTGHGVAGGWSSPSFKVNNVSTMSNYGKPSVIIANCCHSNHFNTEVCFGEALMRRGDNAGAVAYIGATNETYWDDDFYWTIGFRENIYSSMFANGPIYDADYLGMYDRLFHTANETFADRYTTMGAMIHAGNMAVVKGEIYQEYIDYYWEIYNLLGDPSLSPWLGKPRRLALDYPQPVTRTSPTITAYTEPYAYVALLSADGTRVISAAFADAGGTATLSLDPTIGDGAIDIVATAQNRLPAFGTIQLTDDPSVSMTISRLQVNNAIAGDTVDFSFVITNLTDNPLQNINYTLRGDPSKITPITLSEYIDKLEPHQSKQIEHRCRSLLTTAIADQTTVPLTMQFIADTLVSTCNIFATVSAPRYVIKSHLATGIIAPNDTISVTLTLTNRGHADAHDIICSLQQPYGMATTTTPPITIHSLPQDEETVLTYQLALGPDIQGMKEIPLHLIVTQRGESTVLPFALNNFSDDFESNDFSRLRWHTDGIYPWIVIDTFAAYGTHCARTWPDLPNNYNSMLSLQFEAIADDSVSFYYRTSSEQGVDVLSVKIDNNTVLTSSGIDAQWHRAAIAVTAGIHVIDFFYSKDGSYAAGEDCAWIDGLRLPDSSSQVTFLALDTICQGSEYIFNGEPVNTDTTGYVHLSVSRNDTTWHTSLLVLEQPRLRILTSDTSVMPGQSAYLTARGATSYLWNTGDSEASISVTPTDTTTYSVIGFLASCTDTASITIGIRPLSIDTVQDKKPCIYPNPTDGTITIVANNLTGLMVSDMFGRPLFTHSANPTDDTHTISISNLPQGLYLLHLIGLNQTTSHKIVKQ